MKRGQIERLQTKEAYAPLGRMKCQTLHHDMSISAKLGESDNASILSADTRNGAKAANAIDDNDNKWLSR